MRSTVGVGERLKGAMIYFSPERWETLITRNKQPAAVGAVEGGQVVMHLQ